MLAMSICTSGCSHSAVKPRNEERQSETNGFGTPAALLDGLRISLSTGDEGLYRKCFTEAGPLEQGLHLTFKMAQATLRFRETVVKIYGDEGWEKYHQPDREIGAPPSLTVDVVPTQKEWWDNIAIQKQGDGALFYNPASGMTNRMAKIDGGWKINIDSVFGPEIDRIKFVTYLKASAEAIEEMTTELTSNKIPIGEIGPLLFKKVSEKRKSSQSLQK